MSYARLFDGIRESTGAKPPADTAVDQTVWGDLWGQLLRITAFKGPFSSTTTIVKSMAADSMPVWIAATDKTTAVMVQDLQDFFGINVKETAAMLNVSRPMVYHYMKGMEPALEKKRRLSLLSSIVSEWQAFEGSAIQHRLKEQQPEGKTLFDYLSAEQIDIVAVREVLRRATASDRQVREEFAKSIEAGESTAQRRDIAEQRRAAGKPVYVADHDDRDRVIRVSPDGTRTRGRLVNREFIPDGE